KEIEKLYDLPVNTVIQDIRRGKVDYRNVRKSGKIWLVTRGEANKRYSDYEQTRKRKKRDYPKKDNLFFICLKLSEYSEQHRAYLRRFCIDLNVIYPIFHSDPHRAYMSLLRAYCRKLI